MKSKITIDVDYYNNPVIEARVAHYHPLDLRDKMLQRFFEKLREENWQYGESRWFKFNDDISSCGENGCSETFIDYTIYPIKPADMLNEAAEMIQRASGNKAWKEGTMDYYEIITAAVLSKLGIGALADNASVKSGLTHLITQKVDEINKERGGIFTADDMRSRIYSITQDGEYMNSMRIAAKYAAGEIPVLVTDNK